jgi:hypothetical protein
MKTLTTDFLSCLCCVNISVFHRRILALKMSLFVAIASRAADGGCGTLRAGDPSGHGSRQPSIIVERDPRATTAQQYSKGLILLKKQTTYLSKSLILQAHEIGTFCIDCTGTPIEKNHLFGRKIRIVQSESLNVGYVA